MATFANGFYSVIVVHLTFQPRVERARSNPIRDPGRRIGWVPLPAAGEAPESGHGDQERSDRSTTAKSLDPHRQLRRPIRAIFPLGHISAAYSSPHSSHATTVRWESHRPIRWDPTTRRDIILIIKHYIQGWSHGRTPSNQSRERNARSGRRWHLHRNR